MKEAVKKFIKIWIWCTILLFVFRCMIAMDDFKTIATTHDVIEFIYSLYGYAGEAFSIASIFMTLFNKYLWKTKCFKWLAGGMPVLAKKYTGTISFIWKDIHQTRESEIKIEQTFLNVSIKLNTSESSSNSITAAIETINNEKQLLYTYLNTPRAEVQDRSPLHYGTAILKLDNPNRHIGNYYTGRLSRGSMDFKAVSS